MNAFEELELNFKKEFKIVFKRLSHQMMYFEAVCLLDLLKGNEYTDVQSNAYKWQIKFKEFLNK